MERVWLVRLIFLLDKFEKKTQVGKILALKTMSEIVQKMLKQWSTQEKCHRKSLEKTKPEHPSICCCVNSLKTSAMVASSFTTYKPLRLLQICTNKKAGHPSSRDWSNEKSQEVLKNWQEALGAQVNAHAGGENCNMTVVQKLLCGWKLACTIAWEVMVFIMLLCYFVKATFLCQCTILAVNKV